MVVAKETVLIEDQGLEILILELVEDESQLARLTPALREVAQLLLAGLSYGAIADARETSKHTVANQVSTIYRAFGVGSRGELADALKLSGGRELSEGRELSGVAGSVAAEE